MTPDRDHLFVGVHLATPVLRLGEVTLSYAPNVVPLVVLTNNPRSESRPRGDGLPPQVTEVGRGPAIGAHAVQIGYKFHHLSNLYTAPANPGVDAHVFHAGFQWSTRTPR
ncbi:MAG TPA: acyloxyacyl hydrolase [Gemmatimonadaceae bacterium]|nr:acyloxyacyl hydrolase [Gemmatimonadaceae bacterium]